MIKFIIHFFIGICLLQLPSQNVSAQWVQINSNPGGIIRGLSVINDSIFACTTPYVDGSGGGLFLSTDKGFSWSKMAINTYNYDLKVFGNKFFLCTYDSGVCVSTNRGNSWAMVNQNMNGRWALRFAILGNNIFAGFYKGGGILRSTDNGINWLPVNNGLSNNSVYSLCVSENKIFAATDSARVFLSIDSGAHWTIVNNGLPSISNGNCLWASGKNVLAGISGQIYISENNGASWLKATGIPLSGNDYVGAFANYGNNVFAVLCGQSEAGVYLSTDNGISWTAVNTGLVGWVGDGMAVVDNYLYVGHQLSGLWRRPLSEMVEVIDHKNIGASQMFSEFHIAAPSRTNLKIVIDFTLSNQELITVKVYSLSGLEIDNLVDKYFTAGAHRLTCNCQRISCGQYIVRMEAGSNSYLKKVLIFR